MSTVTTNMGLTVPTIGQTVGPTYAQEINSDLSIVDDHDHTSGKGVQVPSSGLNINTDLTFQGVNATALRTVRFSSQGTALSLGTDLRCIYAVNADLYYNDGSGNQVRITQSGGVAGSPGSITNLTSPASAAYVAASLKFVWQSDVNTPAHMDAGSVILRNMVAGGSGLTLAPPTLSGNYTLTLPQIPGVNAFLGVDTSGNITTIASVSLGIARTNMAAVGQIAATPVPVMNPGAAVQSFFIGSATATITTTGRPVFIMPTPGVNSSSTFIIAASPNGFTKFPRFDFSYTRGSTTIATYRVGFSTQLPFAIVVSSGGGTLDNSFSSIPSGYAFIPPPFMDVIGAGTYTYGMKITDSTIGSSAFTIQNVSLVAYEL